MTIPVHCAHTALVDPNSLKPNPVNPNRHSAHQIQLLASIIQEQGWRNPVWRANEAGEGETRERILLLSDGVAPDTPTGKALYDSRCPIGHVRKDVPPLLICDGESDSIVPGIHGRALHEKLKDVGADSTYWMTPGGGHGFPGGPEFAEILLSFIERTSESREPSAHR